ncbi:hypothetical protein MOE90_02070 [Bacillus spizizenii]|nr:hypothetical protein [Bacillus spizizenii]MCY9127437.1 hypothetical protein [Bacillus spizizenii]
MTKIHVLADETLGGIKREYVEVDRKAEVGEKVVIVESECFPVGFIGTVDEFDDYFDDGSFDLIERYGGESFVDAEADEYHVLEPTDIVHIGDPDGTTQRYELTDRKAEVGEKVLVYDPYHRSVDVEDFRGECNGEYRVLAPVEAEADEPQPVDAVFAIGNVAQEVAKLKRTVVRLINEIDTLHKDNRTLGEELVRLKEPKDNEINYEDAALVFIQRKVAGPVEVYQDGKRLRGVISVNINAKVGELTTHTIEFGTGHTAGDRP